MPPVPPGWRKQSTPAHSAPLRSPLSARPGQGRPLTLPSKLFSSTSLMSAESWPRGWANGDVSPEQQLYPRPLPLLLLLLLLSLPISLPPPPSRASQTASRSSAKWRLRSVCARHRAEGGARLGPPVTKEAPPAGQRAAAAISFGGARCACAASAPCAPRPVGGRPACSRQLSGARRRGSAGLPAPPRTKAGAVASAVAVARRDDQPSHLSR